LEPKALAAIPIAQYAEVTGAWTTDDERVLEVRGRGAGGRQSTARQGTGGCMQPGAGAVPGAAAEAAPPLLAAPRAPPDPHPPARPQALDPLHVWAPGFLETRLKWRKSQPITLLELRAYRLDPPLTLPRRDDLFGCFSWVGLPADVAASDVAAALASRVPALGADAFAERQALLRERLRGLDVQPLEL
jgi:hypothetical protein